MYKVFVMLSISRDDYSIEEFDGVEYKTKAAAKAALDKVLEDPVLGHEITGYYIEEVKV